MEVLTGSSFEVEALTASGFNIQVAHSISFLVTSLLVPMLGYVEVPSVLLH